MNHAARSTLLQTLGLIAVIALVATLTRFLPVAEWLRGAEEWMAAAGPMGLFLFPLVYAAANILLLPGGILNIGAGLFFGVWTGFLLVLAGNILSAAIAYGIGRTFGRSWLQKRWLHDPRWVRLDHAIARQGWKIILLSQLNPLFPTSLINYLYGMSRIRFWSCVLWVAIGQAPSRLLYAYLGAAGHFGLTMLAGEHTPTRTDYLLWIGGLVLAVAATGVLAWIAHNMLREFGAQEDEDATAEEAEERLPDLSR